jgi:hypothetical protein
MIKNSGATQSDQASHTMAKKQPDCFNGSRGREDSEDGKISACQAIERGEVPSIRIGRRILIPRMALEQVLNRFSIPKIYSQ